jgi:NADPH-dependent 2,4-dienoyl-CoA reductase/sulfur reductase-like enzyme
VFLAPEIIHGEKTVENARVVVAGSGLTGLETAEILAAKGNQVTVIEMAKELAPGAWFQMVDDALDRLKGTGTAFLTGTKLISVEEDGVIVEEEKTKDRRKLPADHLVLALGVRPTGQLADELKKLGLARVYAVGDAKKSGTIADACHSAFDTVMGIQ